MSKVTFDWGSRCVECGKTMPAGQEQGCEYGGKCNHHVPAAVRAEIESIFRSSQLIGLEYANTIRNLNAYIEFLRESK